jgi:hypothetical protein
MQTIRGLQKSVILLIAENKDENYFFFLRLSLPTSLLESLGEEEDEKGT